MDWKLKKMWPAAAASLVAVTSVINAVDDAQVRNLESRVSTLEKSRGSNGMINPAARPEVKDGYNVFVNAELLWWSAYQSGLDYVVENRDSTTMIGNGEVKNVGNEYTFGARFGAGYNMPHDGWDVCANWAFLRTDDIHDSAKAPHGGALFPIWNNSDLDTDGDNLYVDSASAKWDLDLDIVDAELGREFFVSKWLTVRPLVGLRYARVDQSFHVVYKNGNLFNGLKNEVHNSNNYWGFGARTGLDTQWGLGAGWSIYGNAAVSLLHGHFHISQSIKSNNPGTNLDSNNGHFENRLRAGRAITDIALGLRWDHMFENDRYHVGLQLGWEHHMFFGMNQMWQLVSQNVEAAHNTSNEELTTQGFTLAARFDF